MKNHTPLRIAMLSIHSSPVGPLGTRNTGGMSVYVRETARWMAHAGHDVDLFTYIPGRPEPIELYPRVRLLHLNSTETEAIPKERLFGHLPAAARKLEVYAQEQGLTYDVIHSHYWLSGVVGAMVQKRWRAPHITMFHTLGRMKNRTTPGEAEPVLRIENERKLVHTTDAIVAPSAGEKFNLIDGYGAAPEKVRLIPCGVDHDRFKPGDRRSARERLHIDPAAQVVLFVGRFAPVKGLDALLGAAAALTERFKRLQLVVVGGDGPQAETTWALMDRARQLGVDSHLTLAGRVDHDELHYYYNAADLLIQPSTYESFGLVTLESLACGTPVAATAVGGAADIIEEGINGTLIRQSTGEAVARGIERVLIQLQHRRLSAPQIRESIAEFSWDRIAALVLDVYENCL